MNEFLDYYLQHNVPIIILNIHLLKSPVKELLQLKPSFTTLIALKIKNIYLNVTLFEQKIVNLMNENFNAMHASVTVYM